MKAGKLAVQVLLVSVGFVAGVFVYPAIASKATAVDASSDCGTTIYGQCVYPKQSQEEIEAICQSEYSCEVIVDIGAGTVTYRENPAPEQSSQPPATPAPEGSVDPVETPAPPSDPCLPAE